MIYNDRFSLQNVTYGQIRRLAKVIQKRLYGLSGEAVWRAYDQLEHSKVEGPGWRRLLTNIVALVRFAVGQSDVLQAFTFTVDERLDLAGSTGGRGPRLYA
jgi:type I restriction enzyme R subunit